MKKPKPNAWVFWDRFYRGYKLSFKEPRWYPLPKAWGSDSEGLLSKRVARLLCGNDLPTGNDLFGVHIESSVVERWEMRDE